MSDYLGRRQRSKAGLGPAALAITSEGWRKNGRQCPERTARITPCAGAPTRAVMQRSRARDIASSASRHRSWLAMSSALFISFERRCLRSP